MQRSVLDNASEDQTKQVHLLMKLLCPGPSLLNGGKPTQSKSQNQMRPAIQKERKKTTSGMLKDLLNMLLSFIHLPPNPAKFRGIWDQGVVFHNMSKALTAFPQAQRPESGSRRTESTCIFKAPGGPWNAVFLSFLSVLCFRCQHKVQLAISALQSAGAGGEQQEQQSLSPLSQRYAHHTF